MKLLIKTADISNVSRKFEVADRWCDILCEEFFRQGELERANGMEYTSPMNDREHLDKPKSQIGFYKNVCIPLIELLQSFIPKLNDIFEQASSNLSKWIDRSNAKKSVENADELITEEQFQQTNEELLPKDDIVPKERIPDFKS